MCKPVTKVSYFFDFFFEIHIIFIGAELIGVYFLFTLKEMLIIVTIICIHAFCHILIIKVFY